ncbi:MAG: hypothetical protein HY369_03635 [Candidatus Aenigmarchaeota archaeon]|nr:hypothetical protein [Candidatus Aenigmarchaeota archaeon]
MSEKTKPVRTFRAGGVTASVWINVVDKDGAQVKLPSIRITRTYRDADGFKETSRFAVGDLPKVQLVAAKAYEHLAMGGQDDAAGGAET